MGEKITANANCLDYLTIRGKEDWHEVFNEVGQLSATIDVYGA